MHAAGTSRRASGQVIGETSRQSSLNPDASKFYPGQTPEDSRTMFLTFSLGHPLSRDEIIDFLTSNRGEVVQNVFIERTQLGKDAQFGRIVFTNSLVIPRILNGQTKAKFMVNRKHLWARIYVPRRRGSSVLESSIHIYIMIHMGNHGYSFYITKDDEAYMKGAQSYKDMLLTEASKALTLSYINPSFFINLPEADMKRAKDVLGMATAKSQTFLY
ncbi:hypothetical protein OIU76_018253 [Salix suchowensis]|nr:hypothetical protein OIU76_018253 [Salix suchowensis]KAJ6342330.1 hypothetical protein OIU78_010289 [Salix suchowensis]